MNTINTFSTTDLNCAAVLIASGIEFTGIEAIYGTDRVNFTFKDSSELKRICAQYWVHRLPAENIAKVFDAQRFLKNLIHNR